LIVVDAGFLLELLLGRTAAVEAIGPELEGQEHEPLYAPELIELEVLNALRRVVLRQVVDERRAADAVTALSQARLATYPHSPLLDRVWQLRHNLTSYDASYLALAELLPDSVQMTTDAGLTAAARESLGSERVRLVT
jgi:predicted nucleic acid-binding protein